jgi:hypothetical protein
MMALTGNSCLLYNTLGYGVQIKRIKKCCAQNKKEIYLLYLIILCFRMKIKIEKPIVG